MISPSAEQIAQQFHEAYERLAPSFGYETREASRKPWADVPEQNKRLMIAVCATLLASLSQELERIRTEHEDLLARSGKPDDHRDFSIHAPTDGGKS